MADILCWMFLMKNLRAAEVFECNFNLNTCLRLLYCIRWVVADLKVVCAPVQLQRLGPRLLLVSFPGCLWPLSSPPRGMADEKPAGASLHLCLTFASL